MANLENNVNHFLLLLLLYFPWLSPAPSWAVESPEVLRVSPLYFFCNVRWDHCGLDLLQPLENGLDLDWVVGRYVVVFGGVRTKVEELDLGVAVTVLEKETILYKKNNMCTQGIHKVGFRVVVRLWWVLTAQEKGKPLCFNHFSVQIQVSRQF